MGLSSRVHTGQRVGRGLHAILLNFFPDFSALASPALHETPSRGADSSPCLVQDESTPVGVNAVNSNLIHDTPVGRYHQEPKSPKPPAYISIHKSRRSSGSSSDIPLSNPSSPEPTTKAKHMGGIRLPGMQDDRTLQNRKLSRNNGPFASLRSSQVSEESPGSIASYSEKVYRKGSLPQQDSREEFHNEVRETSLDSGPGNVRLAWTRSDSAMKQVEEADGKFEQREDSERSDFIRRHSTPTAQELKLRQQNSEEDLAQLPVGDAWEDKERKNSADENLLVRVVCVVDVAVVVFVVIAAVAVVSIVAVVVDASVVSHSVVVVFAARVVAAAAAAAALTGLFVLLLFVLLVFLLRWLLLFRFFFFLLLFLLFLVFLSLLLFVVIVVVLVISVFVVSVVAVSVVVSVVSVVSVVVVAVIAVVVVSAVVASVVAVVFVVIVVASAVVVVVVVAVIAIIAVVSVVVDASVVSPSVVFAAVVLVATTAVIVLVATFISMDTDAFPSVTFGL